MLYLDSDSPKTINRNHLLVKIKRKEHRISWSAKFKSEMADNFYPIESWPNYAIELLLTKDLGYSERIGLACFFHGNGFKDPEKALRTFQFHNSAWTWDRGWSMAFQKFQHLFGYLGHSDDFSSDTGSRIRNEYYYYDINLKLTVYYERPVRERNVEKRRYFPLLKKYNGSLN